MFFPVPDLPDTTGPWLLALTTVVQLFLICGYFPGKTEDGGQESDPGDT